MKVPRKYSLAQIVAVPVEAALRCIGELLDDLFRSVNAVAFGPIATGVRAHQFDAVWLVASFATAATDTTFLHNLGRQPAGFFEVKTVPDGGETQVNGEIQMVSATATAVVLNCAGANKKARLLLF